MFFLKTVFQIDSLRKLTRFLHQYPSFRVSCGLYFVPHVSTFSRVGTWFREKGIPIIHEKVLQELNLELIPCVLIDSTALRSSLYDSQAKWENLPVMVGIKDIRLMFVRHQKVLCCLTRLQQRTSMIAKWLLYCFRIYKTKMCYFPLQMLLMIVNAFDEIARTCNVFATNPINPRNGEQNKSTHRRVLSHFIQTILGKQLMKERGKIEQQFSKLKDKGLEQPRWYGQNRYLLHVQLVFLIHNIAYLFWILQQPST